MFEQSNEPITEPTPKAHREFSTIETVFAWICFLIGYAFCRVFPAVVNPFGGFLFVIALFTLTAILLHVKGVKLLGMPLVALITAVLMASSLLFSSNEFIHFFAYAYCLATFGYFVFISFGNSAGRGFHNLFLLDYFKALLVMPFQSFFALFRGAFSGKGKINGRFLGKILLGITIAVIPTATVLVLLSYDSGFTDIIIHILDFGFGDLLGHLGSLILGIPIGMYVYGLFIASADNKASHIWTAQQCDTLAKRVKIAPTLTVLSAVLPVLAVYVIFFISQWKYYVSGFVGQLPDATSYAEYAREGFFQLCTVSVINFLIIMAIGLFTKQNKEKPTIIQRILTIILSLFTLVLITTAIAKMALYIHRYGLTQKRVYATWFMGVLTLLFIMVIVKQFLKRFKVLAIGGAIVVCSFMLLSFANTDQMIVEYNVDRYLDGSISSFDTDAMEELGDAAIPGMVRLVTTLDRIYGTNLLDFQNQRGSMTSMKYVQYRDVCASLYHTAYLRDRDLWQTTIPKLRADAALKKCGITQSVEEWAQSVKDEDRFPDRAYLH